MVFSVPSPFRAFLVDLSGEILVQVWPKGQVLWLVGIARVILPGNLVEQLNKLPLPLFQLFELQVAISVTVDAPKPVKNVDVGQSGPGNSERMCRSENGLRIDQFPVLPTRLADHVDRQLSEPRKLANG